MKVFKLYFLIALLILGLQSFAQNEKISIGIKLLPGLSKTTNRVENNFKFSMGGGCQFVSNFNEVIGIESGLYFRNYGYGIDENLTDNEGNVLGTFNIKYNYNYLTIPALLRINIHSFYIAAGTDLDFFIAGTINYQGVYIQGVPDSKAEIENAKSFLINPNLNFGYQFSINDKFGINLEGKFSYSINGFHENDNSWQFINTGLGIGFCYFIIPKE